MHGAPILLTIAITATAASPAALASGVNGCALADAVYVGDAGAVTFGAGDFPAMHFAGATGAEWQAAHTGGHGRGANYYDGA